MRLRICCSNWKGQAVTSIHRTVGSRHSGTHVSRHRLPAQVAERNNSEATHCFVKFPNLEESNNLNAPFIHFGTETHLSTVSMTWFLLTLGWETPHFGSPFQSLMPNDAQPSCIWKIVEVLYIYLLIYLFIFIFNIYGLDMDSPLMDLWFMMIFPVGYPLVNIPKTMENHHIEWENSL